MSDPTNDRFAAMLRRMQERAPDADPPSRTCSECGQPAGYSDLCAPCMAHLRHLESRRGLPWPELLHRHGVPRRYALQVPEGLELPPTPDGAPELAEWSGCGEDGSGPWVVALVGPNGCGKTWAAAAIFGRLLREHAWDGLWLSVAEAMEAIKAEIREPEGPGRGLIEAMVGADVLVLDDLRTIRGSEYELERIRYVLMRRYEDLAPATLLTVDAGDRAGGKRQKLLEPRLHDRVRDGLVVAMSGDSMRGRGTRDETGGR